MSTAPLLLLPLLSLAVPQDERPFDLMVGDPAPPIVVAEWVQGAPVERYEPGTAYVVEFWATWCGPCKVAIPHLNELSKKYAGKVQFISVSVSEDISEEEPYWVPCFVEEMGDKMTYTVASDRVREDDPPRMNESWMRAAGQSGIPTAFLVDGGGKVAWIGDPMAMDEPLAEVAAGSWDLERAAKKYAKDMRLKSVTAKLAKDVIHAKKEKAFAKALRVIDEAIAENEGLEARFGLDKYFLHLEIEQRKEAAAYGQRLVAQVIADNPVALNQLAWTIVDPQGRWKNGDYALAVKAAERAVELLKGEDASTLDTLGLALFRIGKVERAIEVQEKAVALAEGEKWLEKELRGRLVEFKNAQKP